MITLPERSKNFAGVAEIGKTTETSSEPHYYDNVPAIVINSTGSDEITLTTSSSSAGRSCKYHWTGL